MAIQDYIGGVDLFRQRHRNPAGLRQVRISRLRKLVEHAYENVPVYRDLFADRGLDPKRIRSFHDLQQLPIVDRHTLQSLDAGYRLARNVDPEACLIRHTGGSSGQPVAFFGLASELNFEALGWLRTWRKLGLRIGDHQATIKYPDDVVVRRTNCWYQRLGFLKVSYLDLRAMTHRLLDELQTLQPDVIRAPPSILISLAREIRNRPNAMRLTPRLTFSTGEKLSRSAAGYVTDSIGSKVHDCYGATEAGCIAWRCPLCDLFHLNSDYVHLEILKDGRPAAVGEVGEVVVTNLFRFAMPIIRVSLGDLSEVVETGDCPASPDPVSLNGILGRTIEPFQLSNGSEFSPYSFMPDDLPGIMAYKIVQEAPGRVRIFVVPGENLTTETLEQERVSFEKLAPGSLSVSFTLIDRLPSPRDQVTHHLQASVQGSKLAPGLLELNHRPPEHSGCGLREHSTTRSWSAVARAVD